MNLLARYNMLRTAVVAMIGVPDDPETLKQMASVLRVPATVDADAAASLLVLQTLITTHGTTEQEVPDAWVQRLLNWTGDSRISEDDARKALHHILFGEPS